MADERECVYVIVNVALCRTRDLDYVLMDSVVHLQDTITILADFAYDNCRCEDQFHHSNGT